MSVGTLAQGTAEPALKAAFLYNFPKFVQWPIETFQSAAEPLVICVAGQDPFGRSLSPHQGRVYE